MVYFAFIALALSIIAGFLGIYDLGISMQAGFAAFWALVAIGVGLLGYEAYRHPEFTER